MATATFCLDAPAAAGLGGRELRRRNLPKSAGWLSVKGADLLHVGCERKGVLNVGARCAGREWVGGESGFDVGAALEISVVY